MFYSSSVECTIDNLRQAIILSIVDGAADAVGYPIADILSANGVLKCDSTAMNLQVLSPHVSDASAAADESGGTRQALVTFLQHFSTQPRQIARVFFSIGDMRPGFPH